MKLLYIVGRSGCDYWRCYTPAWAMQRNKMADIRFCTTTEMKSKEVTEGLVWCDAVILRGLYGMDGLAIFRKYNETRLPIFADYDDHFLAASPFNPAYAQFGIEEVEAEDPDTKERTFLWKDGKNGFDIRKNRLNRRAYSDLLFELNLVTTPSAVLKEAMREYRKSTIDVIPNSIDFNLWRPITGVRGQYDDEFRFGWAVADSHGPDWIQHGEMLREFLLSHPKAKFVIIGDTHLDVTKKLPKEQVEQHFFSSMYEGRYPVAMASLGLDVGICPLADLEFNKHKSPLKFVEYTAFGYPVIAQGGSPYGDVIIPGETGLLAKSQDQWLNALETLYSNPGLRSKLWTNASIQCKALYDANTIAGDWARSYQKAINDISNF